MQVEKDEQTLPFNSLAYVYPPDIKKSIKHRLANRIFRNLDVKTDPVEVCECCGKYVGQEATVGTYCYDPQLQLGYMGPGVPLLFIFIQNTALTLLLLILVVSLLGLILNILSTHCFSGLTCSSMDIFSQIALTQEKVDQNNFQLLVYTIFVFTCLWIFFNQWFVYRCRVSENKVDQDMITPSDFAIFLLELPENTQQSDIQDMLQHKRNVLKIMLAVEKDKKQRERLTRIADFKVQMIIFPYKLSSFMAQEKQQEKQFISCVQNGNSQDFCRRKLEKPQQKCNKAIVVFEDSAAKDEFLASTSFLKEIQEYFCNWGSEPNSYYIKDQKITVSRASEPEDIIWENLEQESKTIYFNKIKTNVFGVLVLVIGGGVQLGFAVWQIKSQQPVLNTFVVGCSTVLIMVTNYILEELVCWATAKEGNITKSKFNASLNIKVCLFQFFNTGIFYILAQFMAFKIVGTNSGFSIRVILATNISVFMIVNAISESNINLLFAWLDFPKCVYRWLHKKGWKKYSQKQCNQIYELRDSNIPWKYAYMIKTVWLACFYGPFAPLVVFVAAVGIFLFYFTTKVSFRHFYKTTEVRSKQTNLRALRLSYFSPFMLNFGLLLLYLYIRDSFPSFPTLGLALLIVSISLSFIYCFMPWNHLNEYLLPLNIKNTAMYSEVRDLFEINYDSCIFRHFNEFLLNQLKRISLDDRNQYKLVLQKYKTSLRESGGDQLLETCNRLVTRQFKTVGDLP